jgi:protein tyrosine/serine phosphatase
MKEVKELGIVSIICLLAEDQLTLYDELPGDLVSYYRSFGFAVEHVPALDYQDPPLNDYHLERIWSAYQSLEKPVLIHCSAGRDRTGRAVEHIESQLAGVS